MADKTRKAPIWDGVRIRALRQHLGLTQIEMAARLGTRQQTISEWEKGIYRPRGTSATLLTMVADSATFKYDAAHAAVHAAGHGAERGTGHDAHREADEHAPRI